MDALLDDGFSHISALGRKLKCQDFFKDRESQPKLPFTEPTGWSPPEEKVNPKISGFVRACMARTGTLGLFPNQNNLTASERRALRKLRKNQKIVIKPADKGSATVIMSRENYIRAAHKLLSNKNHYKKLPAPIWRENILKFNTILRDLEKEGHITSRQYKYLEASYEAQTRKFYLLPKIHKDVKSWTDKLTPPGRPIISDCSSESYHISELIDYYLKPIANRYDSYVKNTEDFLRKIEQLKVPENAFLATLDIESMYTNIGIDAGIRSIRKAFQAFPDASRPDNHILDLLTLSLKGNDFEFNGEHFQQIKGCAMGKKFSPNFASIYVAQWEEEALDKVDKKPLCWFRYLDDIFLVWPHSKDDFDKFLSTLNQQNSDITLKGTISKDSVDFLDVTVYKGNRHADSGTLDTKVYFKPTDSHKLLHSKSFHPKHTFKGIVKSQIIRFYRNSSCKESFNEACSILFKALKPQGYSKRFLRQIKSQTVRHLISEPQVDPNAYQPSKVSINRQTIDQGAIHHCLKPRCRLHKYIPAGMTRFQSYHTKSIYSLKSDLACDTNNVIYLINCKICKKQYVGQTCQPLRNRMALHLSNIRHEIEGPVSDHFNLPGHNFETDLEIIPIEQTPFLDSLGDREKLRLNREAYWIETLKTFRPFGLNIEQGSRDRERTQVIPFIIRYSNKMLQVSKIVKDEFKDLQNQIPHLGEARFVVAFQRNPSLRSLLVHSKLRSTDPA